MQRAQADGRWAAAYPAQSQATVPDDLQQALDANREAFGRWQFRPRVMSGLAPPSTATSVLGLPLSMPVLTAPFGAEGLFHNQGHLAVARANATAGTLSIVPEAGTHSLEDVAAASPAAARCMSAPSGTCAINAASAARTLETE